VTGETRNVRWRSGGRGISSLANFVALHDRDRYQTALFAPAERREALFALYAFNYEIARVRESVTQPMLGQIRLQWWREAIDAAYGSAPLRQHEVVEALAAMIRQHAPRRDLFDRLIDTRERDLADEPPVDMAALVDYADGTSGVLLQAAVEVLGVSNPAAREAAREVGVAYALAGLIRAMPFHARAGRSYIPADVAHHAGLDLEAYARLRDSAPLRAVTATMAKAVAAHLQVAREQLPRMPRDARAALLPAVIASRFLIRLARAGHNPFAPALADADPVQSWRLFVAALQRRF
jgi:NADH dehydrogenase [ubiquinone] 1 alpha subcomplex assembly factor 6